MSASLVGSEMCIRDRFDSAQGRLPRCSPPQLLRRSRTKHSVPANSTFPVSYTHLTLPTICSV
eukprot:2801865-Alexandrium_andersonii.AAC.1